MSGMCMSVMSIVSRGEGARASRLLAACTLNALAMHPARRVEALGQRRAGERGRVRMQVHGTQDGTHSTRTRGYRHDSDEGGRERGRERCCGAAVGTAGAGCGV